MSGQLTFNEKIIEIDLAKFRETKDINYYISAKNLYEQDKSINIFSSMKKEIAETPLLALRMALIDGYYLNSLQILVGNKFSQQEIMDALFFIHQKVKRNEFLAIIEVAEEKLFRYVFIGSDEDFDIDAIKEQNHFIKIILSYLIFSDFVLEKQILDWEKELEKQFISDSDLATAYHKFWSIIDEYYKSKSI